MESILYTEKTPVHSEKFSRRLTLWYLCAFAATLPFDRLYSELILAGFIIHVMLHFKYVMPLGWDNLLLSSVFIFTVLSSIYSSDRGIAIEVVEKRLAFLAFPLCLSMIRGHLKSARAAVLGCFSWTCFIVLFFLLLRVAVLIIKNNLGAASFWSIYFTNHNFTAVIEMHATYFAMFVFLSSLYFMQQFFLTRNSSKKILYFIINCILVFGLIQLFSRSVCMAYLVVITFIVPFFFVVRNYRVIYFLSIFLIAAILILLISARSELKERFFIDLKKDLTSRVESNDAVEPRALRWKCGMEIFASSPVFGFGPGGEDKKLMEKYEQKKMYISYINKLNAHNEYVSFMITGGLIGLSVFLYYLFAGFRRSLQSRDFIFIGFLVLIIIVSFSENILSVNKGIFFVAFFYTFFWYSEKEYIKLKTNH